MRLSEVFRKNLRARREGLGLSQEHLAEISGLHRTYISGLELGKRNPTLQVIERISTALGVQAHELLRPPARS